MKPGVLGFVNYTHPAATQFFNNAIMGNGSSNHNADLVPLQRGMLGSNLHQIKSDSAQTEYHVSFLLQQF